MQHRRNRRNNHSPHSRAKGGRGASRRLRVPGGLPESSTGRRQPQTIEVDHTP